MELKHFLLDMFLYHTALTTKCRFYFVAKISFPPALHHYGMGWKSFCGVSIRGAFGTRQGVIREGEWFPIESGTMGIA
jgi:hypothetical protein